MLASLFDILPDVAERETRCLETQGGGELPAAEFGLLELFCADPACDCRRVSLMVMRRGEREPDATISHAFEGGDLAADGSRTYLDPLHRQVDHAPALLRLIVHILQVDTDYEARLEQHYRLVKQAVADPRHPCHERLAAKAKLPAPERGGQLRPGSIGTRRNPVVLRVPDEATAERMAQVADQMDVHFIIEIAAGRPADLSDVERIGQMRGPPAHLSRHERRAWEKQHRRLR